MNHCLACGKIIEKIDTNDEICENCSENYHLNGLAPDERYFSLAEIFQKEDAEKALKCIQKMKHKGVHVLLLEGEVAENCGLYRKACESYENAVAMDASLLQDERITMFLGKYYAGEANRETGMFRKKLFGQKAGFYLKRYPTVSKKMEARKEIYTFSKRSYKNHYSRMFEVAKIYVNSGNYSRAIIELRETLALLPDKRNLLSYRDLKGKVVLTRENDGYLEDAFAYFRTTAIQSYLLIAQCYAMVEQRDRALHYMEDALYIAPNHPEAIQMYDELLAPHEKNEILLKTWMENSFHRMEQLFQDQTEELKETIYEAQDELLMTLSDQQTYYTELIKETAGLLEAHHMEMSEVVGLTLEEVREMKRDLNQYMAALQELHQVKNRNSHIEDKEELFELLADKFAIQVEDYLGSFVEKRDAFENKLMQEFGEYWDMLHEASKQFLITSEIIFHAYKYYRGIDFSPAVIPLTKAIEQEMHDKLFLPLREYCDRKYPDLPSEKTVKEKLPIGLYMIKNHQVLPVTTPTMGTYYKILGGGQKSLQLLKDAKLTKPDYLGTEEELKEFYQTLKGIADKRNGVCHRNGITIDQATVLREIIVWEKKFLRKFLASLSFEG